MNINSLNYTKLFLTFFMALLWVSCTPLNAREFSFSWAEIGGSVEGYNLYYKEGGSASIPFDGTSANEGDSPIDVGNQTSITLSGLDSYKTYHFTLTAYSGEKESDFTPVITVNSNDGPDNISSVLPVILRFLIDTESEAER